MQGPYATGRLVTIFGGSGFLGRHLVRALVRRGWRVRVAVRRPDLAFHLQPLGMVGQIHAVQANLRYPQSVAAALVGADAAVNLVGILSESRRQDFDAIHHVGARTAAVAAAEAGAAPFVHVSAIGADEHSRSRYCRSKAAGEAAVRATLPGAVIVRPSVQFGPEDGFFNRFAGLARLLPVLPLPGGGTRLQPVYVGDVAEAIALALDGAVPAGTTLELGGPEIATFAALIGDMLKVIERRRIIVPLPGPLAVAAGAVLQRLPGKLLTADQARQLRTDNVVSREAIAEGRTLEGLGITPASLAAILPTYLGRFRARGQFERQRGV